MTHTSPPARVWRVLYGAAVLHLVAAVALIVTISAARFDPPPQAQAGAAWLLESRTVAPGEEQISWLDEPQLPDAFTLRLDASLAAGARDSGYGLAIGEEGRFLAVAVSPTGYASVWRETAGEQAIMLPWQPWPHVRLGSAQNEIQIDVRPATPHISVRINRQLLWQSDWPDGEQGALMGQSPHAAGLLLQTFAGEATVKFERLTLFPAPSGD